MATKKKTNTYEGPAWTKAQRALLAGSRRPHPLDPIIPITREESWAIVLKLARERDARLEDVVFEDDAARALYQPIQDSYDSGNAPTVLDPITEQIRFGALLPNSSFDKTDRELVQALVSFWVSTQGVAWFFELNRADLFYGIGSTYTTRNGKSGTWRLFDGKNHKSHMPAWGGLLSQAEPRDALRRYLFALPEIEWEKARQIGLQWYNNRALIPNEDFTKSEDELVAFVLSRDSSLVHTLLDERIKSYVRQSDCLFAACTDLSLSTALVNKYVSVLLMRGARYSLDLVETFGNKAAPILQHMLDYAAKTKRALNPADTKRLQAVLALALTDPRP